LVDDLQSVPILKEVFKYMFCGSVSSLTNALSIAIVLVQSDVERRREPDPEYEQIHVDPNQDVKIEKDLPEKLSPILEYVIQALPKLMEYLYKPTELDGTGLKTQY